MRELKIGKSVLLTKDISCSKNGEPGCKIEVPFVNVQVVVTKKCNADCEFCTYHDNKDKTTFDFELFKRGLYEIRSKAEIPTVTFTGGETTLDIETLYKCCMLVRKMGSNIRVKVNTNGRVLKDLLDWDIWWISLSRHSADDEENEKIFRTTGLPTLSDLKSITPEQMKKMHVSCNIIKGYVDTFEKMQNFIDIVGDTGIPDIGFVSLMGVNDYAKQHSIDFSELNIHDTDRWMLGLSCEYISKSICACKCHTYSVLTKSNKLLVAFNRFAVDNTCNDSTIVYNINKWQHGFSGPLIEI